MYSYAKQTFKLKYIALALQFLCVTAVHATSLEQPQATRPGTTREVALNLTAAAPVVRLDDLARLSARPLPVSPVSVSPLSVPVSAAEYRLSARELGFGVLEGYPGQAGRAETVPGADQLTTASIASAASAAPAVTAIRKDLPLFGAHRIRFGKIKSASRISALIRKAAADGASAICVNQCAAMAADLSGTAASPAERLRQVSRLVNQQISYSSDARMHGRLDQWSTPNETLARGEGDCEDYAILKMALLAGAGIPLEAMEIVVLKDTSRRLFHAVLAVSLNGGSYILDNMTDAVEPDLAKRSYAPLFSISGTANYVFGYKSGQSKLAASIGEILSVAPGAGF